jgi:Flp pilus assembly protein TadD
VKLKPAHAGAHQAQAWLLANCPKAHLRNPAQAVALAKKAVQLAPQDGDNWTTLGAAYYRVGNWAEAVVALNKSRELKPGWDAYAWFFLAMAHQKLGNPSEARKAYD